MQPLKVKGVPIGTGRPKTIVPVMEQDGESVVTAATDAVHAGAELVEWRLDYLDGLEEPGTIPHAAGLLAQALPTTPIVATIRTKSQGGVVELGASDYAALVRTLIETRAADIIDIEHAGTGDGQCARLTEHAHACGLLTIASRHDFSGTPQVSEMVEAIYDLARTGADIAKLAVLAHTPQDAFHLMEATAEAVSGLECVLLTLAMGTAGKITRMAGEAFGSAITFCSLGEASAPGQVELAPAARALSALHLALDPNSTQGGASW